MGRFWGCTGFLERPELLLEALLFPEPLLCVVDFFCVVEAPVCASQGYVWMNVKIRVSTPTAQQ